MDLKHVNTLEELKMAKNKFYGKEGQMKQLQMSIRTAPNEEKGKIGKQITALKTEAESAFALKAEEIKLNAIKLKMDAEWEDVTSPMSKQNSLHPLTLVANRFKDWFLNNGYFETKGSEIESDEYNFERLNIGKDHPARDMQDSLYINSKTLLRTHNTGFTAHELEENVNQAFAHFTIGKVYRNDDDDQTHSHQFMQADLVAVGDYTFPNLIWTLKSLMSYVLEEEVEVRLRPSFFPFTEPSVEVDIKYHNKWIEVLGAGMLNQAVLDKAGYTNDMTAYAAGIGIERIAMIKYNISDIREFYKNDLRFLSQFKAVA